MDPISTPAAPGLDELRNDFPGWQIQHLAHGEMRRDARQRRLRPPGGIAQILAASPEHLRELLTAATALNTRHLGRMP